MRGPDSLSAAASGFLVILVVTLSGCHLGKSPEDVAPATSPSGTGVILELNTPARDRIEGELIAVREGDLVILTDLGLTSVPHEAIRRREFSDAPGLGRWSDTPEKRAALAKFSRYPFGLDEQLLDDLLRAYAQDELARVR